MQSVANEGQMSVTGFCLIWQRPTSGLRQFVLIFL